MPEYILVCEPKPDFLVRLAQRGFDDRFAAIETTTRKSELARMVLQSGRAARNEETGVAVIVGGDDDCDGGWTQRGIRLNSSLEARQVRADSDSKRGVEDMVWLAHGFEHRPFHAA